MTDALTLCKGSRPCAFGEITVEADTLMAVESRAALQRLRERYPDLIALTGQAFRDHADYPRYSADYSVEALWAPAMRAAWAGTGASPTADDLRASTKNEVNRCLMAIVRLNPDLGDDLPDVVERIEREDARKGAADPNS